MNKIKTNEKSKALTFFAVYGILPFLCLLLCTVIVLLQFVSSRLVFPDETLPLYRQLSLYHLAYSSLPTESEERDSAALMLSFTDLPTETLSCLPSLPQGVFPIVTTTIALGSGLINATDYSADLSVQASAKPSAPAEEGPTVLVLHSHATESFYEPENAPIRTLVLGQSEEVFGYYEQGLSPRSTDDEKNMVEVGRVFCEELSRHGIEAVHCKTQHDLDYSQSYANSLASIEEYLEKYPSIRYVLDLHRDSLVRENGTKLKPTCVIDGESVAQVMLVVGAGSAELAQPNWKENLALSSRYQSYLSEISTEFTRPVYLRYGRFNQHLGRQTMLLEVGSCGNTLEEACRASKYAAAALAQMITEADGAA